MSDSRKNLLVNLLGILVLLAALAFVWLDIRSEHARIFATEGALTAQVLKLRSDLDADISEDAMRTAALTKIDDLSRRLDSMEETLREKPMARKAKR